MFKDHPLNETAPVFQILLDLTVILFSYIKKNIHPSHCGSMVKH